MKLPACATLGSLVVMAMLSPLRADMNEITHRYKAAYESKVGAKYARAVADLDDRYLEGLERALKQASAQGKLEESVALRDEMERIKDGKPVPEGGEASPALADMRATYVAELTKLAEKRNEASKGLAEKFDRALKAHQEELTVAGKLDQALKVKAYRAEGLLEILVGDSLAIAPPSMDPGGPLQPAEVKVSGSYGHDKKGVRGNHQVAYAHDGDPGSTWSSGAWNGWIEYDLGKVHSLRSISALLQFDPPGSGSYELYVSDEPILTDRSEATRLNRFSGNWKDQDVLKHECDARVTARFVQLQCISSKAWFNLREFEVHAR